MKTPIRTILMSTIVAMAAGSAAAASLGSATITVLHPYTLEPVPKVPVTIVRVFKPESLPPVYWTGRNGSVTLTNLEEGRYETFVSFNNIVSERVRFEVIMDYHPFVTVFFNPDINN